jgi:mannose-1-phosphate guanylyltransferase/phosphomannomutase
MAGGQGTRLRPLTSNQPKPMLPIMGQPMLQHILRLLRRGGMSEVVITVQFLASIIRNFFGDGSDLDLSLTYATEDEPLGTAGSVKNAERFLDEPFLVISGDAVTDIDLREIIDFHRASEAAVTVTMKRVMDPLEFGIVITDEDGRIERFLEKPGWGEVFSDTINTGIYVIEPEVLEFVPHGEEFDFAQDLFPLLLEKGLPMYGHVAEGSWTDVGNVDAYLEVHRSVLDGEVSLELDAFELTGGIWLGEGAEIDPEAQVEGPVFVGPNSRIEGGAVLRAHSVVGANVVVKSGAFLHRALVHDNAYIGPQAALEGCVIGKNTDVTHAARVGEGAVIGDECYIGEGAVLNPSVKVYPFKTVEAGALVSQSIIWESKGSRSLFGERGVEGLVNVDITPELALRLGMAFASTLPKRSAFVASRGVTAAARIIKRAIVAGANASGVDVHDLELVPAPVARFYARSARATSGIYVRTSPQDPASVDIVFFDGRGVDIDAGAQRKVERNFYRDDLRRVLAHEIGDLSFPARGREYYIREMLNVVDVQAVRARAPKMVVDYAFGATSLTGSGVLGRLGVDLLAVNATLDEERVMVSDADEVADHLDQLQRLVRSSGAGLGVMFDAAGERIRLVDETGRVLTLTQALLALVSLVARSTPYPRVAIPVSTSRHAEEIVRRHGGEVVWTPISAHALMAAAEDHGVMFAGAEGGGYIFPEFLASFDGLMSVVKVLELMARTRTSLGRVVDEIPEFHMVRRDVPTPWEAKGAIMRRLLERTDDSAITIDGVKVYRGEDWALVVPHQQEPVIRVWAEAGTEEEAHALATEFADLVFELKG